MKQLVLILLFTTSICSFAQKKKIYLGADLSYINEIEACGASYKDKGKPVEPYQLFKEKGCNLVRIRIWHSPKESYYSGLEDVKKSIKRAKNLNMEVLLDFHLSDTWADPDHQNIPKAWANLTNIKILGDSVYNYTLNTLLKLSKEKLLPDMVEVGNEINTEILQPEGKVKQDIDWNRNALLLNKGIAGVRQASKITKKKIQIMLHIAQPENTLSWFDTATKNKVTDYDWIGISYYKYYSSMEFDGLVATMKTLIATYGKQVLVVETSYPYTTQNIDKSYMDKGLIKGYPPTSEGQRNYMIDLTKITLENGGSGVVYWEPALVSSPCSPKWLGDLLYGNGVFFDANNSNEALPVFDFFSLKNYLEK